MEDDKKLVKKWPSRNMTIRITNHVCGRVDVHKNISKDEISWFTCNPNLEVEILDYSGSQSQQSD